MTDKPDDVSAAAIKIKEIDRQSALGYHLAIGEVIVKQVLRGVFPGKDAEVPSLSTLAAIDGMPKKLVLWRALRAYELSVRFPELLTMKHVGMSHVRHVLTLAEDQQRELLERVERGRWSEVRVQEAAKQLRRYLRDQSEPLASTPSWSSKLAKERARLAEFELALETAELADDAEIGRILALVEDIRKVLAKLEACFSGRRAAA